MAEAPTEESIAVLDASVIAEVHGRSADLGATTGARVADLADGAWPDAANAARAADASANGAAVETLLSNAEAARTPSRATLAAELKTLLGEDAARAETLAAVKAVRLSAPVAPADGESRPVPQIAGLAAESAVPADALAKAAPFDDEGSADGLAEKAAALSERSGSIEESGAARTSDGAAEAARVPSAAHTANAAHAASSQDGVAAVGSASIARTAADPSGNAERAAPYSQIAQEIFTALANKNVPAVLSMRLEPAELGRIDVSMKLTSAGKLVIDIAAESARTQALLAGRTDKLVQALGLQNVQVESVNANVGNVFQGQQPAYTYGDRSMAFFMDLAQGGGREERPDRDGKEAYAQDGRTVAGNAAEESTPAVARYARRLDLTA
jgi:flagellar hook-length control protein FliK